MKNKLSNITSHLVNLYLSFGRRNIEIATAFGAA